MRGGDAAYPNVWRMSEGWPTMTGTGTGTGTGASGRR